MRPSLRPLIAVVLVLLGVACNQGEEPSASDVTLELDLRWVESYPQQRRAHVETGLLWTLSFLGAALPADSGDVLSWDGDVVELRLDRAGIALDRLPHWRRLLAVMRSSGEYQVTGAIDVGRFVALTLCSANHYYALTGANPDYSNTRSDFVFDPLAIAIVESTVAVGDRLIEVSESLSPSEIAFVAHEGPGSLAFDSFRAIEHEVLDVMPNGQLRFALYDASGRLKPAAGTEFSAAGKPSKCLWCHETELSRAFRGRTSVPGYQSLAEFEQLVAAGNENLAVMRDSLDSQVDFRWTQDHTYAELLYLSFYEPSAARLANEWGLSAERVVELVAGLPTHTQVEFDYLGEALYDREDVDGLAPYEVLRVPSDPREPSAYEPDLLR